MKKILFLFIFLVGLLVSCDRGPSEKFIDEINTKTDLSSMSVTDFSIADSTISIVLPSGNTTNAYLWQADKIYLTQNLSTFYYFDVDVIKSIVDSTSGDSGVSINYDKIISQIINRSDFSFDDFDYSNNVYTLNESYYRRVVDEETYNKLPKIKVSFEYVKQINKATIEYSNQVSVIINYDKGVICSINAIVNHDNIQLTASAKVDNKTLNSINIDATISGKNFKCTSKSSKAVNQYKQKVYAEDCDLQSGKNLIYTFIK